MQQLPCGSGAFSISFLARVVLSQAGTSSITVFLVQSFKIQLKILQVGADQAVLADKSEVGDLSAWCRAWAWPGQRLACSAWPSARQLRHQGPGDGGIRQGAGQERSSFFPCCMLAVGVAALEQNGLRGVFVVLCLPAGEHREQPLQP